MGPSTQISLNTLKGLNSSSLELEFENGIGDCWVRGFGRFEMGREGEI